MNIIITAKNFSLSAANTLLTKTEVSRLLQFDKSLFEARVELDADKKERDNKKFRVEIWVRGEKHSKAGAHGPDLVATLKICVKKLKRQLSDQQAKVVSNKKRVTLE